YLREGVGLGHRRLAIIDPELGQQPMSNADETLWLTYNGEMYNYIELKGELARLGHRFVTNSDTEVVIHAYDEWGAACVEKFRGMFAFALADFRSRKVFIARDHFGIKPLYYRVGDGYLAFASELSALREVEDAPPAGSLLAVDLYLRYNYIPIPHTIYQDVYKLPPASYIWVDFDGGCGEPVRYWDVEFKPESGLSEQEWEERAEGIIRDSVKSHLVSDVPFGVFLSGGIDSTLVAWNMSRLLERPVKAFSIGFNEQEHSELSYAEEAARRCGVELHAEVIRDDALRILPDLVSHYGEPFGDSSAIPTWYVSRLAREHVPMVLSGDGGDEAFGGYWSYDYWMENDNRLLARRLLRSAFESSKQFAPRASFYWLRKSIRKYVSRSNQLNEWQELVFYMREHARRELWRDEYHDVIDSSCNLYEDAAARARNWHRLAYAQYLDFRTYLPCDILTKVDVASMYHGLEVRTPLVDRRVVELATSLPVSQRFRRERSGKAVGKYLLKKILGRVFPPEFIHRQKKGFGIPRAEWFMPGQSGRALFEQVVLDPASRLHKLFNPAEVKKSIEVHTVEHDNSGPLWLLLFLGLWLEQNPEVEFTSAEVGVGAGV
ncbi:MAG TPA: asparagine synthase (glutamine-hydrolyzing), partial [Pyrinomonadaceae bacterium]|nr:asparagine synthase (glutamine-hydrolyzing) [Pyrinomonadaceae bacterium]